MMLRVFVTRMLAWMNSINLILWLEILKLIWFHGSRPNWNPIPVSVKHMFTLYLVSRLHDLDRGSVYKWLMVERRSELSDEASTGNGRQSVASIVSMMWFYTSKKQRRGIILGQNTNSRRDLLSLSERLRIMRHGEVTPGFDHSVMIIYYHLFFASL